MRRRGTLRRALGLALVVGAAVSSCGGSFGGDADPVEDAGVARSTLDGADEPSPRAPSDASVDAPVVFPPASWIPVPTQHGDAARTGANLRERCLSPATVSRVREERRFHVGGQIYAQPLVATDVLVGGALHALLLVATTANEVAAFDLDAPGAAPLWKIGPDVLGTPAYVVRNVSGPLGILATPAIDPARDRAFVVARSCPSATSTSGCHHGLFALRLSTGDVVDRVDVSASFGSVTFQPDWQWNRPGLLLQGGLVYLAWGAGQSGNQHEEELDYHGWITAFRADDLRAPPRVWATTLAHRGAGIWQAGAGLAGDGESVYATSGNSVLVGDAAVSPSDFPPKPIDDEDSILRLRFDADGGVDHARYWDPRPYDDGGDVFQYMERWDVDFSSAGAALVPGSTDLVVGAKSGVVYLLDRTTLAPLAAPLSAFHEVALPPNQSLYVSSYAAAPQVLGAPVVWHDDAMGDASAIYLWPRYDRLTRLRHVAGTHTIAVEATSLDVASAGGGMLALSADGAKDGIVWAVVGASGTGGEASELRAYDAATLARLWSTPVGGYAKFVCPTISGGRVFVARWSSDGTSEVVAFAPTSCP